MLSNCLVKPGLKKEAPDAVFPGGGFTAFGAGFLRLLLNFHVN